MENHDSVLVVDDDEAILDMLRDTLQETYEVDTASDVLEAADLLREKNYDLLILDLNMPVVDGEELMDIFSVHPHFETHSAQALFRRRPAAHGQSNHSRIPDRAPAFSPVRRITTSVVIACKNTRPVATIGRVFL